LFLFQRPRHFDLSAYDAYLSKKLEDYEYPDEKIKEALKDLPLARAIKKDMDGQSHGLPSIST